MAEDGCPAVDRMMLGWPATKVPLLHGAEGVFEAVGEVAAPSAVQHPPYRPLARVGVIEALVGEEQAGAAALCGELPGDGGVGPRAAGPADAQKFEWAHGEDLAVNDAVEAPGGVGAEGESMPDAGLEVVGHEPSGEQDGISQGAPHLLRRVGQERVGADVGTHVCSSSRSRRAMRRLLQNCS